MALQFRSLFPLALPGMLALLGWWWFFSRKKDHVSRHSRQAEASAAELSADSAVKEPPPVEDVCAAVVSAPPSVTQPPEKEPSAASKPSAEPPALLRIQAARRRSESSGSLPNATDTRPRPGTRKDDSAKLDLALTGDDAKSIPPECPLSSPFPHEAAEVCKQESVFSRTPGRGWPGQSAAPAEKHGPGDRARETGGAEGTGDAVLGENVLEEGLLSQERVSELENSKAPRLAPLGGGGEKGRSGLPQVLVPTQQKEEYVVGKLLSSFIESAHTELAKDDETPAPSVRGGKAWDRDLAGELGNEESLDRSDKIEQAAFQIISQVILEATEEVLATTVGKIAGRIYQASAAQLQGQKEQSCVPGSPKTVLGQNAAEPTLATAEAATSPLDAAPPAPALLAEDLPPPKTYVSCLSSPLSSPTKDNKPKNSAHPIALAPCPPPAAPLRESLDGEDATCMSDNSQGVPSVASSGHCSDSLSTSGLEDSGTETNSSPRDKAITPPLPESTVPFSNGVLKGELSDLGAEDGWTLDAEADHSGGSDGNSMDSVDSCGSLRKTEGFQNAQAGSSPKKVDLIIWEIEVPKHLVGRLIGKQGRYVSFLKQTSGAKIYISTLPYTQSIQICHIEGSQHHVDKALNLIGKKFKELNLTNIYAPPLPSLALPSLPMTSWLMLPDGITVEVIVVNQVNAGHLFVQQHTHPTFHALRSLDQQMYLCYSQPGIPTLPTPVEITVICAAPGVDGAWWRAQVVASYEETNEVEIRYVDYGGYKRVKVDVLRQIRSDFVTLPFQGTEVLLDSVMPLSDDDHFSPEADAAMSEMTGNTALLAQVTSYSPTGLPLIQLWSVVGDEVVLINRSLVERGLAQWVDSYYGSL
ncbi:PREDICTED: A-kinase anchor protein 1, mitochondrial isoform X1 [Propithecus coquereli]|uniref:A-kinase anchor protein 1, mitochondrial n=1 Tax=Propithecus coquereli TaxID=379532 RepID=A0A2K6ES93_PROCO|nr:PREDICTED: A-kinase anchor protein 1, mitochondrial isoform X1 [Propithecus coquereli]XP_012521151.1 PREDICTED: A-kinase anchor protein 1, mitochondrial isoform X1 [Propithecus coquereli]XP_012521152.1 PREDICTED: A-kinase anchor protein 1, mitochondrial isoform X1 [Propithecus coquereli]